MLTTEIRLLKKEKVIMDDLIEEIDRMDKRGAITPDPKSRVKVTFDRKTDRNPRLTPREAE